MNHDYTTRVFEESARREKEEERRKARSRLIGELRFFPPEERASEAEAAIQSLAKQEARREAKLEAIRALSDDDLDKLQIC